MQLAHFLGFAKMALIVAVVGGLNPFPLVSGNPEGTPAWYEWLLTNKLYACLMIFFISELFIFSV